MASPTISFTPAGGGPGTLVNISGWGFVPGAPVAVRLGLPQPMGEVLASAVADAGGRWNASFTMPGTVPSGEPILSREMFLVAMNDQNQALASAPFAFVPGAQPAPSPEAGVATVRDFLAGYFGGTTVIGYVGGPLGDEVSAGRPLGQFMGDQPGYQSHTVYEPEFRPGDLLFVDADVVYRDATVSNNFELSVIGGEWRIVRIMVTATRPHQGQPADQWKSALSGDITGDGTTEQVNYRPAQIKLPPVGFTDPAIVNLMIAGEMNVLMEASPGGRELLYLSPATLMAEGRLLASFDGPTPPAGFIVVVYGGATHSFRITPLRADGQAWDNKAYEVVWNAAEGGYRLTGQ